MCKECRTAAMAVGWFFGCKRFGDICKNFGRLGLAKCRFVRPSRRMILGGILGPVWRS